MQSTGHTSTQAVSLVSIHGSVMMNGMLACLRLSRWSPVCLPDLKGRPSAARTAGLYPDNRQKHHRARRFAVAERLVQRLAVPAGIERDRGDAVLAAPDVDRLHDQA